MKDKYIDETVGRYYLWPEGLYKSDIATSKTGDVIAEDVSSEYASALVEDRNKLVDALTMAINLHREDAHTVLATIRGEIYE